MNEVLAKLLETHVQHELALWQGDGLARTLTERVSALFRWCAEVKLDDVMTREQIVGVIDRYVIELRISGGITELTGEMSHLVFTSRASADARIDEVLTPEMYEEFADKVIALEGVRRELIALIAHSSTMSAISAQLVARGLLDMIIVAIPLPNILESLPGTTFAAKLRDRILPGLERQVAELIIRVHKRLSDDGEKHAVEVLSPDRLRTLVDEVWERVSSMHLSEVFAVLDEQDVEDFVVLVYEFWLRYRKTAFFRRISSEVVDYFFTKYGGETLLSLIDDMGVTEEMVAAEVLALAQPALEHAARSGALETFIRKRLESFYHSPEAAAAVERVPTS